MYNKQLNSYKQTQISTASPGKLVLMMYEGALRFLNLAKQGMQDKKLDIANNNIVKTQKILNELSIVLDLESGGEIAKNLWRLYDYMLYRLIDINLKKDSEGIQEIVGMLEELKGAWNIALASEASSGARAVNYKKSASNSSLGPYTTATLDISS
jgi:flagellar protein FliS